MESTGHKGQTWRAEEYAANGRFVSQLAGDVLALLAPKANERILDLGCGDGELTARIAATGARVTACDSDPSMLAATAARGLATVAADMRDLPFHEEFDAVFSNAALHWVREQDRVLASAHRALVPGGRFVAEMGGFGNIAAIRAALAAVVNRYNIDAEVEAASMFPGADEYRSLLESAGFTVVSIALIPRKTHVEAGMEAWLRTFRKGVLQKLNDQDREAAIGDTVAVLMPILQDSSGEWWADYVRLRFHAVRN